MSVRITDLDTIVTLQNGDYVAVDNESTGTHKFDARNLGSNMSHNIADTYSSSSTYSIGEYCLYNNNLYMCTSAITVAEAWNSSHWLQVTIGEELYDKVDKIGGKGLSANDFTNAYKQKLDSIETGAEVNVQADWAQSDSSQEDFIKNKPVTIPSGGTTGQSLKKVSNNNYDIGWGDDHGIPSGGLTGQVLKKVSGTDYDITWSDEDVSLGITGASVGQIIKVLTVDNNGKPLTWQSANLPSNEVSVITNAATTLTLEPCPKTYKWGEVADLTLTVTANSQYRFMFTCPSASVTALTLNGITGTEGDTIEAGKIYKVDVWAGIAFIKEVNITA